MQANHPKASDASANILLAAVCSLGLICLSLVAILELASHRVRMLSRSEAWNSCLPAAEAGIDEALVHCTHDGTNLANSAWVSTNGLYVLNSVVGSAQVSTAIRQITDTNVEITATASCRLPAGGGVVSRTIRVTARREGVFLGGLIVEDGVALKGANLYSDSYDSQDPLKSTNGWYDLAKRGDKGDIYCTAGALDSLNVGTADVYGQLETSPGGTVLVKSGAVVGDLAWHTNGNSGLQEGAWSNELNVSLPDVTAPFTSGLAPRPATAADYKVITDTLPTQVTTQPLVGQPRNRTTTNNYVDPISGVITNVVTTVKSDTRTRTVTTTITTTITYTETYNSVLDGGDYATADFGGQVLVRNNSRIYVWKNMDFTSGFIRLYEGASLIIYNAGQRGVIGDILTTNSSTLQFQYYGLADNTYVELKNKSTLIGLIYAPNAYLKLAGQTTVFGSVVVRSAALSGNASFHYDESTRFAGPYLAYIVTSWEEL